MSLVSLTPFAFCVLVSDPLMPLVALVELPPQKGLLSKRRHFPPCSMMVWAAEKPARPPPTTIACWAGKQHAPVAGVDMFSSFDAEFATMSSCQKQPELRQP